MVSLVSHGIDMRGVLIAALALVHGNDSIGVKRKLAVRIDGHAEQARISLPNKSKAHN